MGPGSAGRVACHMVRHAHPPEGIRLMDSSSSAAGELNWAVRAFIYASIADSGQPPSVAEAAAALDLTAEAARHAFVWLHERPAPFLAAARQALRMAHPIPRVPPDRPRVAHG